jgi:hypothetical protein
MYVDILSPNNYLSINIKTARVFGLETAAYWAELLNIVNKALAKNKVDTNGYFKVDRKYIFERTTVTIEEQLKIDSKLNKIGVLRHQADSDDIIALDIKLMCSILINEDFELLSTIAKKVRTKVTKESKESGRKKVIQNLKDHISDIETNYDIVTALRDWVDGIYAKPKGYLSNKLIDIFVSNLKAYYKDDIQKALKLIEIATVRGWREADWVIKAYEQETRSTQRLISGTGVRITEQARATEETISKKVY